MEKEEGVRSARRRKSLESELQVLYTHSTVIKGTFKQIRMA
jgi:hypothetical protein